MRVRRRGVGFHPTDPQLVVSLTEMENEMPVKLPARQAPRNILGTMRHVATSIDCADDDAGIVIRDRFCWLRRR
jgi:hypothetical protein